MEKSCPGQEGHPPSRVNFTERLPYLLEKAPPSIKRCIWDKKVNKRHTPDVLSADIFALLIMKLSGFFTA